VSDWLSGLWSRLGEGLWAIEGFPWLAPAALVVALMVLAWLLARAAARWLARRPASPQRGPTQRWVGSEPDGLQRLTGARAALARGESRSAVEQLWQAVAELAAPGARPGLTPRATLRQMLATLAPELGEPLTTLLHVHERACYAGMAPGGVEVERLIEAFAPALERPRAARRPSRPEAP
jgi:hypothetical protein